MMHRKTKCPGVWQLGLIVVAALAVGSTLDAAERASQSDSAKWPEHWAFAPLVRPSLPAVARSEDIANPVDFFVRARLEKAGLSPSASADRVTLVRRLSFDLVGLPPTPDEVAAYVDDRRPDAYAHLVNRLLNSPHYGERMAVQWLDLVRYADTIGYHSDNYREIDAYRDYVIRAFNDNMPFDRFTIEQLAGDLLPAATRTQRVASGYNRLNMTTQEGGAQPKEYMAKYAADRVRNVSAVWLGATMACAECHDHKFDPYTMKDFYSLAAFFADLKETPVGKQVGRLRLGTPGQEAELKRLEAAVAALKKRNETADASDEKAAAEGKKKLAAQQRELQEVRKRIPSTLVSEHTSPRMMRILPRGDWMDDSGPVVTPAVPEFLLAFNVEGREATRLDLARWLTARENPLPARAFVNRLWKLFFGRGLASPLDDLGVQGTAPSHPELLDWLAAEFIDSGWDVKHMVRLLTTSATYRQASQPHPELRDRDPYNQQLARQGRFRLDAEMVRDNALAISGLLSLKIGGRSVKPYQPAGYWAHLNFPKRVYQKDDGEAGYRRGLYTYWQRTFLHPSLLAFDSPSREECTAERPRSNTPQQALVLLNDPTYVEAARTFAERVLHHGDSGFQNGLNWAYNRALSRKPNSREIDVLRALFQKHRTEYDADRDAARKLVSTGDRPAPDNIDIAELAAWTSVTRVILNLHETITRR